MALNFFQGRDRASSDTQPGRRERAADHPDDEASQRRPRRPSRAATNETRAPDPADDGDKPRSTRRRRSSSGRSSGEKAETREARADAPATSTRATPPTGDAAIQALLRSVEEQNRKLDRLIALQQAAVDGGSAVPAAALPRVGVFVDAANIELSADRVGRRIDWGKALSMLTRDRRLVRAVAYCPTHDDPGVSMETQRFVEPFLDHGFKIVTKPLKRFADGSIKANVDIELALDLLETCERLDVVCLASGDGDFAHLVEVVQGKGVRVEIVGFNSTVAIQLRRAADAVVDLGPALTGR